MPQQGYPERPKSYAFLLSVWREGAGGPWRAALRPADGGARRGFADPGQLVTYLLGLDDEQMAAAASDPSRPGGTAPAADRNAAAPRDGGDHPR